MDITNFEVGAMLQNVKETIKGGAQSTIYMFWFEEFHNV